MHDARCAMRDVWGSGRWESGTRKSEETLQALDSEDSGARSWDDVTARLCATRLVLILLLPLHNLLHQTYLCSIYCSFSMDARPYYLLHRLGPEVHQRMPAPLIMVYLCASAPSSLSQTRSGSMSKASVAFQVLRSPDSQSTSLSIVNIRSPVLG